MLWMSCSSELTLRKRLRGPKEPALNLICLLNQTPVPRAWPALIRT